MTFGRDYDEVLKYWQRAICNTVPSMPFSEVYLQAKANADQLAASGYKISDDLVVYIRNVLEQLIRVACFTTQPTNYSMWANYGKYLDENGISFDHGGICIEYKCDENWRRTTLHPVQYSDRIPEIEVVKRMESDLVQAMYAKSREWRCEDEWRITSVINARPPFLPIISGNSKMKFEGAVLGVIFGLKSSDDMIEEFTSRLRHERPDLLFKRVVRDVRTFERKLIEL